LKRGTPEHPKTRALARRLKIRLHAAVGLLEMLWHFTADYAPEGDVGRYSNADIANKVDWDHKRADMLIVALLAEQWLDEDPVYRLVVHNWSEHADDYVHRKLARALRFFSDGSAPKAARLGKDERTQIEEWYRTHKTAREAPDVRTEGALRARALALPVPEPVPEPSARSVPLPPILENGMVDPSAPGSFDEFCGVYTGPIPERCWEAFGMAASTPERLAALLKNTPLWMKTKAYRDGFHSADKFLRSGIWLLPPKPELLGEVRRKSPMELAFEQVNTDD